VRLNSVDSITPGNFFALKTWKGRVKTEARTGAAVVLRQAPAGGWAPEELADEAGVRGEVGLEGEVMVVGFGGLAGLFERPTLTKLNLRL